MEQQGDMVRYLVYTWVPDSMLEEWNAWHNDEHIPAVLNSGFMRRARKFRVHDTSLPLAWQPQYVTVYELDSLADFEAYARGPGVELRRDYQERYGNSGQIARMVLAEGRQW